MDGYSHVRAHRERDCISPDVKSGIYCNNSPFGWEKYIKKNIGPKLYIAYCEVGEGRL